MSGWKDVPVIDVEPGDILMLPGLPDQLAREMLPGFARIMEPLGAQVVITDAIRKPVILRSAPAGSNKPRWPWSRKTAEDRAWLLNPAGGGQATPRGDDDALARS